MENIKEVLKNYSELESLVYEIARYSVLIKLISNNYTGDVTISDVNTDTLTIQIWHYYLEDYECLKIPISCLEKDTWQDFLKDRLKEKMRLQREETEKRAEAERAEYERLKKIYG